jgi:hypothetical protein
LKLRICLVVLALLCLREEIALGQENPTPKTDPDVHSPSSPPANSPRKQLEAAPKPTHRFWDKENDWLFAGVAAARTLDYFSTLNLRRRGRQEILITNDAVDDHPAFATIEAAGTGISIGAAYLFHRHGHHTLERWTSIIHIGLASTGDVRNYSLKTFHRRPATP